VGRVRGGTYRGDDVGGGDRVAGEHLAAALDVRAADVDLEAQYAGDPAQPLGQLGEVLDPGAGDGDQRPDAPLGQPRQLVGEEPVDPGSL
jgi:hypothetical protein